ncbi:MAG: hypothetical protein IJZ23_08440 [Roseburia sp.]|nr:hypothetical protein [Roseburia sp.]
MRKIVGFEKFTSKKGMPCCAVSTEVPYTPRDGVQQLGIKAETCMIYGDSVGVIDNKCIGKELVGFIGYSNGVCVVQSPQVQ